MKIGIISDTHGAREVVARAARLFKSHAVDAVFHCGDIGSHDVLAELAVLEVPVHVVLGNVDRYSSDWKFFPTDIGVELHGRFGDIQWGGFRFALLHSDDRRAFDDALHSGTYDFVFCGHSHAVHDFTQGRTRCINPGSAGRGAPDTCAMLDLVSGMLTVLAV
jgi:putative phosphoesterase